MKFWKNNNKREERIRTYGDIKKSVTDLKFLKSKIYCVSLSRIHADTPMGIPLRISGNRLF